MILYLLLDHSSDYVVIAAPIEKVNIQFTNISFSVASRDFVFCYVTHVQASGLNPIYFGLEEGDLVPDSILTTPSSTVPFTVVGIRNYYYYYCLKLINNHLIF